MPCLSTGGLSMRLEKQTNLERDPLNRPDVGCRLNLKAIRREQYRRRAAVAQSMGPMISVTIDSSIPDLGPHWDDLVRRASSNVFMNPAALQAARATDFAQIRMLLA